MQELRELYQFVMVHLQAAHPLWLLGAMALLPLVGVPVSPLWILGGIRFGAGWGSFFAILTTVINISTAYLLSFRWVGVPMARFLEHRGYRVPRLAEADEWKFVLICRLTPGFPLVMQNYLLGCARVQFRRYLLISLPILSLYSLGFVIFGDSLADSHVWPLLLAAGAVVILAWLVRLSWKRLQMRSAAPTMKD